MSEDEPGSQAAQDRLGPNSAAQDRAEQDRAEQGSGSTRAARLNQPWRGALAAVEVLVAAFLLVAVPWAWQRGIVPIQLQGPGSGGVVTRNVGSWLALAIGMGTVAAVLLLNALRQLLLAFRGA